MLKIGDYNAESINLSVPHQGVPVAICLIRGLASPKINETLDLTIDDYKIKGTIVSKNIVNEQAIKLTFVGGRGNLVKSPSRAKNLVDKNAFTILNEIIEDEEEIGLIPSDIQTNIINNFNILVNEPRGHQITYFLSAFNNVFWKINEEGQFIIYEATDTIQLPSRTTLIDKRWDGGVKFQVMEINKMPKPGTLYKNKLVEEIKIEATKSSIILDLITQSSTNKLKEILSLTNNQKHLKTYECKIVAQNADGPDNSIVGGTLQLLPDDATIRGGGLDKVPIKTMHGCLIQVSTDNKAILTFVGGDFKQPAVIAFKQLEDVSSTFIWVLGDNTQAQWLSKSNICNNNFNELKSKLDDLVTYINSHIHNDSLGSPTASPTTPSSVSATVADVACNRIKST